jgi:hypothetical protein
MRRPQRLIATAVLIALSGALAGCGSTGNFDPSDLLDFLDTKKKLPGERKPVFPDGVPGLEQGVPKELYKGAQQQDQANPDMAPQQTAAVPPPPPEEAKPAKQAKSKGKGKQPATAAAPAEQPAATADGEAAPEEDTTPAAPPPPPKAKRVASRKRVTTPDQPADQQAPPAQSAQQQQAPSAFPAPLPSNTFTR